MAHPLGFDLDDLAEAAGGGLVAGAFERLGGGGDGGERGAQFVGGVDEEVAPRGFGLVLLGEVVQGDDDAPDAAFAERRDGSGVAPFAVLDGERLEDALGAGRLDGGVEVGIGDGFDQGGADAGGRGSLGCGQRVARGGVEVDDSSVAVEGEHGVAGGGECVLELGAFGLALVEQLAGAADVVGDDADGAGEFGRRGCGEGGVAGGGGADRLGQASAVAVGGGGGQEQKQQAEQTEGDSGGDAPAALGCGERGGEPDQQGEQGGPERRRGRPPGRHRSNRYPAPRTVMRWRGGASGASILIRSQRTWTSTVRVPPEKLMSQTSSSSWSRVKVRPSRWAR